MSDDKPIYYRLCVHADGGASVSYNFSSIVAAMEAALKINAARIDRGLPVYGHLATFVGDDCVGVQPLEKAT